MQELDFLKIVIIIQALAMFVDEFYFHYRRPLYRWERAGHPLDTLTVIVVFASFYFFDHHENTPIWMVGVMVFSSLFITKDEFEHAKLANPKEQWLHSLLFVIHPTVFFLAWKVWKDSGPTFIHGLQLVVLCIFIVYQIIYWNWIRADEAKTIS